MARAFAVRAKRYQMALLELEARALAARVVGEGRDGSQRTLVRVLLAQLSSGLPPNMAIALRRRFASEVS